MSAAESGWRPRLLGWLDRRAGWRGLMHEALDERVPGGSRWAYVFGSGLLFILVNQIVTGVCLAFYYVPSADHAHATVGYIQKVVWAGRFIRGLHSYGSSVMIVVLALHLAQTFVYGAYKNRRELLWMAGCGLFLLVLGMGFTGYLLPWDRRAYFATAVGTNILSEVPLVGGYLKAFLRAGPDMGTLTLSRFYVLHVFVIPALLFALIAAHVFFFRKAGAAGPPLRAEERDALPTEPFFPMQVLKDFLFGMLMIVVLFVLSALWPVTLGPVASSADSTFVPRPEWYYLPAFQWLKYWSGNGIVLGIIVIPLLLFALLLGIPFLDRSPERRPRRRLLPILGLALVGAGVVGLGFQSAWEDRRDPAVHAKLVAQDSAEEEYNRAPFEPLELTPVGATAAVAVQLSPDAAKGALLFENEGCSGCHGAGGHGAGGLIPLDGFGSQSVATLHDVLRKPLDKMVEGGMEATQLSEPELAQLVAFLREALKDKK